MRQVSARIPARCARLPSFVFRKMRSSLPLSVHFLLLGAHAARVLNPSNRSQAREPRALPGHRSRAETWQSQSSTRAALRRHYMTTDYRLKLQRSGILNRNAMGSVGWSNSSYKSNRSYSTSSPSDTGSRAAPDKSCTSQNRSSTSSTRAGTSPSCLCSAQSPAGQSD